MQQIYRTTLSDTCDRMLDGMNQLVRLAPVGASLDAGVDECLAVQVAAEQMIVSSAEALLRVSQELRVRELLKEEKDINAEVAARKDVLKAANDELCKTMDRLRSECKQALFELNAELVRA